MQVHPVLMLIGFIILGSEGKVKEQYKNYLIFFLSVVLYSAHMY